MKRVTLVSPPDIELQEAGQLHLVEPLGLAYIAAVLEQNGYKVKIIDAYTLKYSLEKTVHEILKSEPDIVGFSCMTPVYPTALNICQEIKKHRNFVTVVGGIHATAFPLIVKEPAIDYAIVGEGEYAFLGMVRVTEGKKKVEEVPGLCYLKNGKLKCNPPERITDLDKLPFPARHLLPMKKYGYSFPIPSDKKRIYASVNFSRGCVYSCIFCNSPAQWKRRVVHRSAENIVTELRELVDKYGVNTFYVRDEVFTLNKKNVIEICKGILREKMDLNWFCYARADHLDEEVLRIMKKAGCKLVKIGVETGDPEIMRLIKKGETLETIEKAFRLADKVGVYTHASFMIGHPWDSYETVNRSISFAKKLNADTVAFPIMIPFPGTEAWEIAKKENLLLTEDFFEFNVLGSAVMKTKYLKPEELVKLQKKALREYYFRLGYIWKAVKRIVADPRRIKTYLEPALLLLKVLKIGKKKGFIGRIKDEYKYSTTKKWSFKDVGDFWDTVKDYDEIDDETYAYKRRFYDSIRMCSIPDKSRVLDIDCRTGNGIVFYHSRGKVKEAVCVSPSPNFLDVCKKRTEKYGVKAETLLLRELPLPLKEKSFDAILSMETVEHVSDHVAFLRELNRLLKDNGELVLTMPNMLWEPIHWFTAIFNIHHSEGPHRFIRRKRMLKFLRKAGFKVEKERTTVLIPAGPRGLTRLGEVIERAMGEPLRRIFCLRRIFICRKY